MIHYKKGLLPGALWLNRNRHRTGPYIHEATRTNMSKSGMQYSSAWLRYIGGDINALIPEDRRGTPDGLKIFHLLENFTPHISDTDKKVFKAKRTIAMLHSFGSISDVHNLLMEVEV
jgi:hypothetical protein